MSASTGIARTPAPPEYAIFLTSKHSEGERSYGVRVQRMVDPGPRYTGFLGRESICRADGVGITVSKSSQRLPIVARTCP